MNTPPREKLSEATDERAELVSAVVVDCLHRRAAGEDLSDDDVLAARPELQPELGSALRRLGLLEHARHRAERAAGSDDNSAHDRASSESASLAAASESGLNVRCPNCHSPNHVSAAADWTDVACSACGSRFSLAGSDRQAPGQPVLTTIGHFELIELLGVGGFGQVWKARDKELERYVAIKLPRRDRLDAAETEQFLREARVAAQLRHPAIVSVYEVGRDGDQVYIVSDLVEGPSLAEWSADQRMTAREAAQLCRQIAEALAHAHSRGIVHRDLKPANILLGTPEPDPRIEEPSTSVIRSTDGSSQITHHSSLRTHHFPYITDFGLASRREYETTVTLDGQLLGTPAYMSPEQARGESHQADHRSDLFALGVILYELLTGELPFRGSTRMVLEQILCDDPARPRSLNGLVPRDLETITLKCLEKDPARRYASAGALSDDLGCYLRGEPIVARPVGRLERGRRWCKRKPAQATLVAMIVLAAFGASWFAVREMGSRRDAEVKAKDTYRKLYFSDMHSAVDALEGGNMVLVMDLLNRHQPQSEREDLRGFEWYYLWQQCQRGLTQRSVRYGKRVLCVAVSPDGGVVAAGGEGFNIMLWDLATANRRRTISGSDGWVNAVAFLPGGTKLACRTDYAVRVWDAASGAALLNIPDDSFANNALAVSRDGGILAAAIDEHRVIRLWDTTTYEELRSIDVAMAPSYSLAISPDGNLLASADAGGSVTLCDPSTGDTRFTLASDCGYPTPMCFTMDGKMLMTGGAGGTIVVWDLESRVPRHTLAGHSKPLTSLALSPDGNLVASASNDGTVRLWDTQRFEVHDTLLGSSGTVHSVTFSRDGRTLAAAEPGGEIRLWDLSTPSPRHILNGHQAGVWCVATSPDGKQIASGAYDGTVRIWDADSGQELRTLAGHAGYVWCAAYDTTGKVLATGGGDGKIRLWDTLNGQLKSELDGHTHWVSSVVFTQDGKSLVSGSMDGTMIVWDLEAMQPRRKYSSVVSPDTLAVSRDSRVFATEEDDDGTIGLRNLRTFELLRTLTGHRGNLGWMVFSPNGQTLASAGHDRTVRLWDWDSGRELRTLVGHTDVVYYVAYSPDGRMLASASVDKTVRLWEVATGEERVVLHGHSGWVTGVAFTPDGRTIVSASGDRTIRLWRAASPETAPRQQ